MNKANVVGLKQQILNYCEAYRIRLLIALVIHDPLALKLSWMLLMIRDTDCK